MKFTISTKVLQSLIGRMASIPGANGANIATQLIKLSCDTGGVSALRLTSEARISITIEEGVSVNEEGECLVSHAGLAALASACPGSETIVTGDDKNLTLESGSAKWKLRAVGDESTMDAPNPDAGGDGVEILLEDLREVFAFTLPGASRDAAASFAFCGVNIQQIKEDLYFTATDRKRCLIAVSDYDLPVNCTIPNEGVECLLKAIGSSTGSATLVISDSAATLTSESVELSVSLLAEPYPNIIQQFLAQSESSIQSKIQVERDALAGAMDACAKVCGGDSKVATLKVEKKRIQIIGSNSRDSDGVITVACQASAPFTTGIPIAVVAQSLNSMPCEEDGSITLCQTPSSIYVKQSNRMAFFALAKAQA